MKLPDPTKSFWVFLAYIFVIALPFIIYDKARWLFWIIVAVVFILGIIWIYEKVRKIF